MPILTRRRLTGLLLAALFTSAGAIILQSSQSSRAGSKWRQWRPAAQSGLEHLVQLPAAFSSYKTWPSNPIDSDTFPVHHSTECRGWDPSSPEERDPPACLRARQYRQVMRVLEREEKAEHQHWYFTRPHNLRTFAALARCFLPDDHADKLECPDRPLIISGWWYTAEVSTGATSGETIWQTSVYRQLTELGMYLALVGPYQNWIEVAEMLPDVYRVLWNSDTETVSCVSDPRCITSEHYVVPERGESLEMVPIEERGQIPIHKLHVVDYWGSKPREYSNNDYWWGLQSDGEWAWHPLGGQFQLTPWPLPGHTHLPYSIEADCLPLPFTPQAERNASVLLLAKRSAYFDWGSATPRKFWSDLAADPLVPYDLVLTAAVEEGHPLPPGLSSRGKQTREQYEELVGDVRAMVGLGAPLISPSVYTALCQGTPVVLPYFTPTKPSMAGWGKYEGLMQHGPAMALGPPYVYSYYSHNYTDLCEAVRQASTTPIERYIPPDMKSDYALRHLRAYLSWDLDAMLAEALTKTGGAVPPLHPGIRERCFELDRCQLLPKGKFK